VCPVSFSVKGDDVMKRYRVIRKNDTVDVLLLPHKDGTGFSYVNLTKGHICPCKFKTMQEALADMDNKDDVIQYYEMAGD